MCIIQPYVLTRNTSRELISVLPNNAATAPIIVWWGLSISIRHIYRDGRTRICCFPIRNLFKWVSGKSYVRCWDLLFFLILSLLSWLMNGSAAVVCGKSIKVIIQDPTHVYRKPLDFNFPLLFSSITMYVEIVKIKIKFSCRTCVLIVILDTRFIMFSIIISSSHIKRNIVFSNCNPA